MSSGKTEPRAQPLRRGRLGTRAAVRPWRSAPWHFRERRAGAGHEGPYTGPHHPAPGSGCPGRHHLPWDLGGTGLQTGPSARRRGRAEGAGGEGLGLELDPGAAPPGPVRPPWPAGVLLPCGATAHRTRVPWTCRAGCRTRARPVAGPASKAGHPEGVAAGAAPGGRWGRGVGRWPVLGPHLAPGPRAFGEGGRSWLGRALPLCPWPLNRVPHWPATQASAWGSQAALGGPTLEQAGWGAGCRAATALTGSRPLSVCACVRRLAQWSGA